MAERDLVVIDKEVGDSSKWDHPQQQSSIDLDENKATCFRNATKLFIFGIISERFGVDMRRNLPIEHEGRPITGWDILIRNETFYSGILFTVADDINFKHVLSELPLLSANNAIERKFVVLKREALPPKDTLKTIGGLVIWLTSQLSTERYILKLMDAENVSLYFEVSRGFDMTITNRIVQRQLMVCLENLSVFQYASDVDAYFDAIKARTVGLPNATQDMFGVAATHAAIPIRTNELFHVQHAFDQRMFEEQFNTEQTMGPFNE